MRVGSRAFPYPVLNSNVELSSYKPDCRFALRFDTREDGSPLLEGRYLVLKNAHFELGSDYLRGLIEEGEAKAMLVVECSLTSYRRHFDIGETPRDIRLLATDLKGTVSVSCFIYSTQDIAGFAPADLLSEYQGYIFDVDGYDILAADDGVDFAVDPDALQDECSSSIFTVVKAEAKDGIMRYGMQERKIVIWLPIEQYNSYDNMKKHSRFNSISFAIMAIPVLAGCFARIKDEGEGSLEGIEDICLQYAWFRSVANSFRDVTGENLDLDGFFAYDDLELAQLVLGRSTCGALDECNEILLGSFYIVDDAEETELEE